MHIEISEIRRRIAAYLKMARDGREIVITRHGKPQVILSPAESRPSGDDAVIDAFCHMRRGGEEGVKTVRKMRSRKRY